jgi:hypothetical protein
MANTYTLISGTTFASAAASHTFTSIPSTYTDLLVKMSTRDSSGTFGQNIKVTYNGSASGYSERLLLGTGTSVASANQATTYMYYMYGDGPSNTANVFGNGEFYIPNYGSANYKSMSADTVNEENASGAYAAFDAGLWSNTAAITSITIAAIGNFVQYSSFYLYGIKNS